MGGPRGRDGVCRELGGGGLNIFFRGRKAHQGYVVILATMACKRKSRKIKLATSTNFMTDSCAKCVSFQEFFFFG